MGNFLTHKYVAIHLLISSYLLSSIKISTFKVASDEIAGKIVPDHITANMNIFFVHPFYLL